jgi:Zn-dependent M28 family amino/carboxypeptidase
MPRPRRAVSGAGRVPRVTPRGGKVRLLALGVVLLLALTACQPGRTRFDEVDGPLRDNVVFPGEFGIDVRGLPVVRTALERVSTGRLGAHVDAIDEPRGTLTVQYAAALRAAGYIAGQLEGAGLDVHFDNVSAFGQTLPNVIADLPGTGCSDTIFVVGAHYDSVTSTPGADDNASGVAGMLEIARVLRSRPLPMTVRFIGFPFEEIGLVGSRQVAQDLAAEGADVTGMVSLEMIGFTATGEDAFLGVPNDYLASVADPQSEYLARVFGAAHFEYVRDRFAPAAVIDPSVLGDIRRSDHATFWDEGFRALLITDTANFRNPNYHQPSDTLASLDLDFLSDATRATAAGLVAFGLVDADDDGTPDVCQGA